MTCRTRRRRLQPVTRDRDQTGPQARDEIVQRFLDGDLTPEEASEAREMMASDPGLRRDADTYRRLGDLLREAAGTQDLEGEVGSAWERVSEGIGGPAADDSGPGVARVWLGEFFRHRKRYWIPVAGAVAGAAAALVVILNVQEVPDIPVVVLDQRFIQVSGFPVEAHYLVNRTAWIVVGAWSV